MFLHMIRTAGAVSIVTAAAFLATTSLTSRAASAAELPAPEVDAALSSGAQETAVFAGGCFWGIEAVYRHVKGVVSATSGYAGGAVAAPSYDQVSSGATGHAESVKIVYDPAQVSYARLLQIFFSVAHDPTQLNRQGPDAGTQYRSAVFYTTDDQKKVTDAYIAQLTRAKAFPRPVVTQVTALKAFFPAESYHQNYAALHPYMPYIVINDAPKVRQLKAKFADVYREPAGK